MCARATIECIECSFAAPFHFDHSFMCASGMALASLCASNFPATTSEIDVAILAAHG